MTLKDKDIAEAQDLPNGGMGKGEHSPLPWTHEEDAFFIADATDKGVIDTVKTSEANAALIVKAVNNHHRLEAENKVLREALTALMEHYVALVGSGDAGFWDAEKESEVIAARIALSNTKEG